jgi:CRISPR-associated endonuclease/helicase Cas3
LFAKSADAGGNRETLLDHSINVVAMIRQLFRRLPPLDEFDAGLLSDLEAAAAAHDIGKAATGFQAMLLGEQRDWQGRRHEVLSAAFAAALHAPEEVVFAVLTHHKRIPDFPPIDDVGRLRFRGNLAEDWDETLRQFESSRTAVAGLWSLLTERIARLDLRDGMSIPMNGAFLRPAWRRADKQRKLISIGERKRASLIRGLLISADHLASANTALPETVDLKRFTPGRRASSGPFALRPFQKRAALQGNVILRAPTGSGKTEAALTWAAFNQPQNGRLFYTLPYTAALNAMHSRLQGEFPERANSIGLLHGRAAHHLLDAMQKDFPGNPAQATAEAQARAHLAREMYHPVRVCTPHQLLRYTLRGKGWEQILTEIPGACVVFDEVHSYDPLLAGLTLGTARLFHRLGARLMFISATLPRFLEQTIADLVPCELLAPDKDLDGDREVMAQRRHVVRVEHQSLLDLLPRIVEAAKSGATILVVCNHVRSSQIMAAALRTHLGTDAVCLFHGRFNMRDRADIERRLAVESLPPVLVATQVVEVSLDISYAQGYFEAAPIDALAQRMGRVNRRAKDPPAPVTIATKPLNQHPLYDSERTRSTLDSLGKLPDAISEQDIVSICDEVYANGYEGEDWNTFKDSVDHKYLTQFEESMVAGDHENWTERVIEVANRIDVLPASLSAEHARLTFERRWLEADRLTVNIRLSRKLDQFLDRSHEPWLIDLPYTADGLATP